MSDKIFDTHTEEETLDLAIRIAKTLQFPATLALYGDLGAGKTVFARGIARGFGIDEAITSPTFTIIQEYPFAEKGSLFHMDLYRLHDDEDALSFGIEDFLIQPDSVSLMEWPSRLTWLMPKNTIKIYFKHVGGDHRQITVPAEIGALL